MTDAALFRLVIPLSLASSGGAWDKEEQGMYRHPYDLEIDARYARERVSRSMADARPVRCIRVEPGVGAEAGGAVRRLLGYWLIAAGQRLAGSTALSPAR